MKQLNQTQKTRKTKQVNDAGGIDYTEVPMTMAYTNRQSNNQKIHREIAREYIGQFVMDASLPVGSSSKFMMNPANLPGTRLARLASTYQKYRFRKLALSVQSSAPTSVGGLYICGYNSNPDAEYSQANAVQAIFQLPGANSANVWRTVTSRAKVEDPNKWYNIDPDSNEIMMTTQGYFAVVQQTPPTGTASLVFPVLLEYDIEFTGSSLSPPSGVAEFAPAGTFQANGANFIINAGEPAIPAIQFNVPYIVNPAYPYNSDTINVVARRNANDRYRFYRSIEDFQSNNLIDQEQEFKVARTQWTPYLN